MKYFVQLVDKFELRINIIIELVLQKLYLKKKPKPSFQK